MNKLLLEVHRYYAIFYKQTKRGGWHKFWQIGNAAVALDIANLLRKLGHKVKIDDRTEPDCD